MFLERIHPQLQEPVLGGWESTRPYRYTADRSLFLLFHIFVNGWEFASMLIGLPSATVGMKSPKFSAITVAPMAHMASRIAQNVVNFESYSTRILTLI